MLKPSRFVVCSDDHNIHYFLQHENTIIRCLWTAPVHQDAKCMIFKEMSEWFDNISNETLISDMKEPDDAVAWAESCVDDI